MSLRAWIVLLAALAGALATGRLGVWQLDRARQKIELHEAQLARGALPPLDAQTLAHTGEAAAAQEHRRVVLQGQWLPRYSVYLDNRQMNGHPGFYLMTPLQIAPGDVVLVQRGWLPRHTQDREHLAPTDTPVGTVQIEGRIAPAVARLYEFDAAASGTIRQNLDVAAFARETALALRPLVVVQGCGIGGAAATVGAGRARRLQALWLCRAVVRAERPDHGSLCLVPTHPTAPPKALKHWA